MRGRACGSAGASAATAAERRVDVHCGAAGNRGQNIVGGYLGAGRVSQAEGDGQLEAISTGGTKLKVAPTGRSDHFRPISHRCIFQLHGSNRIRIPSRVYSDPPFATPVEYGQFNARSSSLLLTVGERTGEE